MSCQLTATRKLAIIITCRKLNRKVVVKSTISLADMRTWQTGLLQSAVHRLTKRLADDYLARYELTTMQWLVVGAILEAEERGVRATDLAERAGTTLSFMTNVINKLVDQGIVERIVSRQDNRVKKLKFAKNQETTHKS